MGIFLNVLMYAFALLPSVVTGVESLVGDSASGATKKQMATDALSAALAGASTVTTGSESALAQLAAKTALAVIDTTGAITTAVNHTRATGAYQAATAQAKVTAAAVSAASQATATPPAPDATPAASTSAGE